MDLRKSQDQAPISLLTIDFQKASIAPYKDLYARILDNVLSREACRELIASAEAQTNSHWEHIAVQGNAGSDEFLMNNTRKCDRIMWDCQSLADYLWSKIEKAVSEIHTLDDWPQVTGNPNVQKGQWKVSGLNERLRFIKYGPGQHFLRRSVGLTRNTADT